MYSTFQCFSLRSVKKEVRENRICFPTPSLTTTILLLSAHPFTTKVLSTHTLSASSTYHASCTPHLCRVVRHGGCAANQAARWRGELAGRMFRALIVH